MSTGLVYLHCALQASRRPVLRGRWPHMPGGGPPRPVPVDGDLWAIVSTVPEDVYGETSVAARLSDVDWLSACGGAHHAVIARAGRRRSVVPFRLLTLFRSQARAVEEVRRLRGPLVRALARVAGRDEWVLRAMAEAPRAAAPPRRAQSGTAYLLARADAPGRPIGLAAARRAVGQMAADVARRADAVERRRADATLPHVLYDATLLVARRRRIELQATVRRWSTRLASSGARLSLTGPWPPYSFVTLSTRSSGRG